MKKYIALVLIASTMNYVAGSEDKTKSVQAPELRHEPTLFVKALKHVDTTHRVTGFLTAFCAGNLFKSRPMIAIPILIISAWQAFIPKAPDAPSITDIGQQIYNKGSVWSYKQLDKLKQWEQKSLAEHTKTQNQQSSEKK
jgi:hypothetical protein